MWYGDTCKSSVYEECVYSVYVQSPISKRAMCSLSCGMVILVNQVCMKSVYSIVCTLQAFCK